MLKDSEKKIPSYVIEEMVNYLYSHGIVMKNTEGKGVIHIPSVIYPSPIVKSFFEKIEFYQIAFNKIFDKLSRDQQFLEEILTPLSESNEFIKKNLEISKKANEFPQKQKIQLNIFRNDFMVDKIKKFIYQTEFNTIAVTMGTFSDEMKRFFSFFSKKYPEYFERFLNKNDREVPIEKADSISTFVDSIIEGIKLFNENYKETLIVFVVQENEKNIFDQRSIENDLWNRFNVKSRRLTLNEIAKNCEYDENKNLKIDNKIISLFYFRSCYTEKDFVDEESWKGREMIELSTAIKVPNINSFLTTFKVFQYYLTKPDILKKFCPEELISNDIIRFFMKIYYVRDMTPEAQKELFAKITENLNDFVVKPQKEGGANNYYGEQIKSLIPEGENEPNDELKNSIIMEKINPPEYETMVLKNDELVLQKVVSEFSVYGVILSDDAKYYLNKSVGFLVRTKDANQNEGGIMTGVAAVDIPFLIDMPVNREDESVIEYTF
jgi:glutathione synthase